MPQLNNYSAIDRDSNKPTGDSLSTQERQELRDRTATQQMIAQLERTAHTDLNAFISQELGAADRIDEVRMAIVQTIRKVSHSGLVYKFKLDWPETVTHPAAHDWGELTANIELPKKWTEADLQKAIAQRLKQHGFTAQLEVKSNGGYADIVSDWDGGVIIEVKKYLDRNAIYQAFGQLNLYGIGSDYNFVITGFMPKDATEKAKAMVTASMIQQDKRVKVLFI